MSSTWIKGIAVGSIVATAGGAIAGYNLSGPVTYRIGDTRSQVRLDQDPGERIPLFNGEISI